MRPAILLITTLAGLLLAACSSGESLDKNETAPASNPDPSAIVEAPATDTPPSTVQGSAGLTPDEYEAGLAWMVSWSDDYYQFRSMYDEYTARALVDDHCLVFDDGSNRFVDYTTTVPDVIAEADAAERLLDTLRQISADFESAASPCWMDGVLDEATIADAEAGMDSLQELYEEVVDELGLQY